MESLYAVGRALFALPTVIEWATRDLTEWALYFIDQVTC